MMLIEFTKQYIEFFNNKDLINIAKLLSDDFILQDPIVKK